MVMDAGLTVVVFLLLIAVAAYVIHRLNAQHAERIALRSYGRRRGDEAGRGDGAQPHAPAAEPLAVHSRRDHRDGGRGRFRPRRRTRLSHS
jgi:hypothetical protein